MSYFVLSFFPRNVLDETWDGTMSVPETLPTYFLLSSVILLFVKVCLSIVPFDVWDTTFGF